MYSPGRISMDFRFETALLSHENLDNSRDLI